MPPALSDEDVSASEEEIPFKKTKIAAAEEPEDNDAGDDEDGEEDEYVVEKVTAHKWDAKEGAFFYHVKWLGWEKPSDMTWEPESNLSGAKDILQGYFDSIGGRLEKLEKGATKKRKSLPAASTPKEEKAAPNSSKRQKTSREASKEKAFQAPNKASWEDDVNGVETIEEVPNEKTGQKERFAYITWNNGQKTKHDLATLYKKCPQKMLKYYEQHLVFKNNSTEEELPSKDETNGVE